MADDVVEAIAARIEFVVGAARTVYRYGVPDGALPDTPHPRDRERWGDVQHNLAGLADRRTPSVDVKSISRSLTAARPPVRRCGALGRSWTP